MTHDNERAGDLTRREMGIFSAAAGVVALTGSQSVRAATALTETDVQIKMPDGICDAAFFHPASGRHPGIILWTDIYGLRPVFREMGKRLAANGYAVLVPNPYYRVGVAPVADGNFAVPAERAKLMELMESLSQSRIQSDAAALVDFLDQQSAVRTSAKIGTSGYCMGGRLAMITASSVPARIGAGGSFHGGGLVTDKPDSPHLKINNMKASFYFGISEDDDEKQPDAKVKLKSAFVEAGLPVEIKVYKDARHGWCVPGKPVYNHDKAEEAWSTLLNLFDTALT